MFPRVTDPPVNARIPKPYVFSPDRLPRAIRTTETIVSDGPAITTAPHPTIVAAERDFTVLRVRRPLIPYNPRFVFTYDGYFKHPVVCLPGDGGRNEQIIIKAPVQYRPGRFRRCRTGTNVRVYRRDKQKRPCTYANLIKDVVRARM